MEYSGLYGLAYILFTPIYAGGKEAELEPAYSTSPPS